VTVTSDALLRGADVHLDPMECELFMELACNAEKVNGGPDRPTVYCDTPRTYLSVSLALGRRLLALRHQD